MIQWTHRVEALVGIVALAGGAACNSATSGASDLPLSSDLGRAADLSVAKTVKVTGALTDFSDGKPIEAVQVCVYEPVITPKPCVMSDAKGAFSLTAPANTQGIISFEKSGYVPALLMGVTTEKDGVLNSNLIKPGATTLLAALVGQTIDDTKGILAMVASSSAPPPDLAGAPGDAGTPPSGISGIVFTLNPASGSGPYYASDSGIPDKTLTATTTSGGAFVLNANPGDVEVQFGKAGLVCEVDSGWPTGKNNVFKVRLAAGYITGMAGACR